MGTAATRRDDVPQVQIAPVADAESRARKGSIEMSTAAPVQYVNLLLVDPPEGDDFPSPSAIISPALCDRLATLWADVLVKDYRARPGH